MKLLQDLIIEIIINIVAEGIIYLVKNNKLESISTPYYDYCPPLEPVHIITKEDGTKIYINTGGRKIC